MFFDKKNKQNAVTLTYFSSKEFQYAFNKQYTYITYRDQIAN